MMITRPMTEEEREWIRTAALRVTRIRLTDTESGWYWVMAMISLVGGFAILHRFVFSRLLPELPWTAIALSAALAAATALIPVFGIYRLRRQLAERMKAHLDLIAEDLQKGVVVVHTHDAVESRFIGDGDPREPSLVIRFPEGDVRVDMAQCAQERILEPVRGWCEVIRLPRSEQVLRVRTDRDAVTSGISDR